MIATLRLMFSRRWWWTTLLAWTAAAVCLRLGLWQLDRLEQRRAFNRQYLAMQAAPPLMLDAETALSADLETMEYRTATVQGQYDFERQVVLVNRYHEGESGYHLLTPLLLAENGPAILVDRGWIPAKGNDNPQAWRQYDAQQRVSLTGLLRLGETEPEIGGINDPPLAPGETWRERWYLVNLERIGAQLPYPLLPVFLQLPPEAERSEPPFPYQPEFEISEGPHMGYALQWFTFAALFLFGYPFYVRRQNAASQQES